MKSIVSIQKIIIAAIIAALPVVASAQGIKFAAKEDIEAAVNAVPCNQDERLEGVKKLFLAAGAKENEIKIEKYDKDKISNVLVRKQGTTDETVIIGAHYDRTDFGCGAVDNWTGVVIMSHIYKAVAPLTTKKSYVFVAFDKEEAGLKGSYQMAKAMTPEQIDKTCAMINFDSFGQAAPMAMRTIASPKLLELARKTGKEGGLKFVDVEIPGASSDSASFLDKKMAAITLSGLGGNWQDILHTSADKVAKVNMESVYIGYRFGLVFTAKVDAAGCKDFK